MSEREDGRGPVAQAMRAAGYRRCRRWWLTPEQWELVCYLAHQNEAAISRIRDRAIRDKWRELNHD